MVATKRKRRGGLAVQAKKPKRKEKDARPPAQQPEVADETEKEERDRIPGPVCKVKRATSSYTWGRRSMLLPCGYLPKYSSTGFGVAEVLRELGRSSPGRTDHRVYI